MSKDMVKKGGFKKDGPKQGGYKRAGARTEDTQKSGYKKPGAKAGGFTKAGAKTEGFKKGFKRDGAKKDTQKRAVAKPEVFRREEFSFKEEVPAEYELWKKAAGRMSNWRERLRAVEALGQWESQQSIDILRRMAANDPVFQVQEAAYRKLLKFGEPAAAPIRKKGELMKGTAKVILRTKKSLPEGHTFEEFKEKLRKVREDLYDTYEGDQGENFDQWLEAAWASASAQKV